MIQTQNTNNLDKVYQCRADYDEIFDFEFTAGDEWDDDQRICEYSKNKIIDQFYYAFEKVLLMNGKINIKTTYDQNAILTQLHKDTGGYGVGCMDRGFVKDHFIYLMQYVACDFIFEPEFEAKEGFKYSDGWIYKI